VRELKLYISIPKAVSPLHSDVIHTLIETFREKLITEFQGLTEYQALGFWRNPKTKEIEKDSVLVFEILTESDLEDTKAIIESELRELKKYLRQECFLYSLSETQFFFI